MIKRILIFTIGAILLITSLPLSSKMFMELIHDQRMSASYKIKNVNDGFPPTNSTYRYKDWVIEVEETLKDEEHYIDPWKYKIGIADLSILIDGKKVDTLKDYPVRVEEKGLNRYYGEIAYLTLEDRKKDEKQFIVLLKKTRELPKEMPNGDIVDWAPDEKLNYTQYILDEEGNLTNQSFSFTDRDALQTEILNAGVVVPYRIGYYTDAWEGYPSLVFPFLFPFSTLAIGLILIILFFPGRKRKN